MTAPKKRFIAGATCPKCGAVDRIVMYHQDGADIRECVECDFSEAMKFQAAPRELETRVNVSEEQKAAETQVVKIIK